MKTMLVSLIVLVVVLAQNATNNYTLGNNLISNPDFSLQPLPYGPGYYYFPTSIVGWKCNDICECQNTSMTCQSNSFNCTGINTTTNLDLDSQGKFDNISQIISIANAGEYLLSVRWLPPIQNRFGKKFKVQFNGSMVLDVAVNSTAFTMYQNVANVTLTAGNLTVNLRMYGTWPDYFGILVTNVILQQKIYPSNNQTNQTNQTSQTNQTHQTNRNNQNSESEQLTQQASELKQMIGLILSNQWSGIINKIPGNRIIFNKLTQFLNIFDRLHLYYFHRQTNTPNSQVFLQQVNYFILQKSSLCQLLIQQCSESSQICQSIMDGFNWLTAKLDRKYNYTASDFLVKNQNGIGFYANQLDSFYFQLPFILATTFMLYNLFHLLFNYRLSVYLRKYSLLAIIPIMLLEGNFEEFSFYLFNELRCFFSADFIHKWANVGLLFILFNLTIVSVAGLIFLRYHYRKLIKTLVEYYNTKTASLLIQSGQRMLFPMAFGCVHALLVHNLLAQTIILTILQIAYLLVRIVSFYHRKALKKSKVSLAFVGSVLRIIFIVTFYLYNSIQNAIFNRIHKDLILIYLGNWLLQVLLDLMEFFCEIVSNLRAEPKQQNEEKNKKAAEDKRLLVRIFKTVEGKTISLYRLQKYQLKKKKKQILKRSKTIGQSQNRVVKKSKLNRTKKECILRKHHINIVLE